MDEQLPDDFIIRVIRSAMEMRWSRRGIPWMDPEEVFASNAEELRMNSYSKEPFISSVMKTLWCQEANAIGPVDCQFYRDMGFANDQP